MEAIRRIVQEIVFMCRVRNVQVSDTLAAFLARAVVLENSAQFPLDKELNESDVQELIRLSTERLVEQDAPSLETVKMQVAFDTARMVESEKLECARLAREQRENQYIRDVADTRLKPGNDVEALTALYRKIFNFLVVRAGLELGADRPAEREIAAALESVFPRIGLKAFTALPQEDKTAQLNELANIVLGIRLFNRHIGKGGAGMVDLPRKAAELASSLITEMDREIGEIDTLAQQYVDVIAYKYASAGPAPGRLQAELTNRRQYGAFLSRLDAGFKQAGSHVEELTRMLLTEIDSLKALVGNRSSVPKEQVYPRFDSLAKLWGSFHEEVALLEARQVTLDTLRAFREPYIPTLRADDLVASRAARRNEEALTGMPMAVMPTAEPTAAAKMLEDGAAGAEASPDVAHELSAEEVAASSHLSLELESFCAYTVVQRDGLLLPASIDFVAKYRERLYGFVDQAALDAFVAEPAKYLTAVLSAAKRMPELIHMLRLQEYFPAASIAEIMRQYSQGVVGTGGQSLLSAPRSFQDSCVQTPTHFIEKNIDQSYEWNEWALRRRALHLANLRQKVTKSQQTDSSAFRREQESQVYLPKESTTMTGISTGTAAPISRNYIAGLRGSPDEQMRLVNLTVDPEITIGKYR